MTIEKAEEMICEAIFETTGKTIQNRKQHLLSDETGVMAVDFLYVFEKLEKKTQCDIYQILERYDYTVFSVENLARALIEIAKG